jgi:hypothetical protein
MQAVVIILALCFAPLAHHVTHIGPSSHPAYDVPSDRRSPVSQSSPLNDQEGQPTILVPGEPWYDDGNIVVQADSGIQFQVHRGALIESSAVLKDLLKELDKTNLPTATGSAILDLQEPPNLVKDVITACYSRR